MRTILNFCNGALVSALLLCRLPVAVADEPLLFERARRNAEHNAEAASRASRTILAVLAEADPETGLIPDNFPPKHHRKRKRIYRPNNTAADLYCYLVAGSFLLHPELYGGQILTMLEKESRFTNARRNIPGDYDLDRRKLGRANVFGAAEYAKDGLISVTELVGDSPWFLRMRDMIVDVMEGGEVDTPYGRIPSAHSELNGDLLQVLPRLYWRTGDKRFRDWARRIAEAYLFEILPRNHFLPARLWDFSAHKGDPIVRLRDHGNETMIGLVLVLAMERIDKSEKVALYEPPIRKMIDRVLASANGDGMLYNAIDPETLMPIDSGIADNWGYVYGAVYNLSLLTGDDEYRRAVERVIAALPRYRNYRWEGDHYDGFADSIEGAIYLLSRMPSRVAEEWTDSEIRHMWRWQNGSGHSDYSYLEGNFIRTSLLYMLLKSQGITAKRWQPGVGVGAARDGDTLYLHLSLNPGAEHWDGEIRFDRARHRDIFQLPVNYIRLNEFPEWYPVESDRNYEVRRRGAREGEVMKGSKLSEGIKLAAGEWIVGPVSAPRK